jgi:starch phosphorylase
MPTGPIFQFDKPTNSVDDLRRAISNRLVYQVGKDLRSATPRDWLYAVVHAVRDRIIDTWRESLAQASEHDAKRVHYLSMEFLTGRASPTPCWRPRFTSPSNKPVACSVPTSMH